ncbi:MAG: hypothetical protein AAFQ99_05960 [Pseudomonadota bacterium]
MKVLIATLATMVFASGVTAPADAEARTSAKRMERCEVAIRDELGPGSTRIKRIRSTNSGDEATFWLTVRHKAEKQAKSVRYRATCSIDGELVPAVEVEEGWWKATGRGKTPVALD